jgi:hypothetical protein
MCPTNAHGSVSSPSTHDIAGIVTDGKPATGTKVTSGQAVGSIL